MIAAGRHGHGCKMPCESCAVQFSVFKRKRACCECERYYCSGCLRRGGGAMCAPCRALSTRPLHRNNIAHLKVRDLQCFLQRQNVSTRGCVEKEELVSLCVGHVNGAAYRRGGGARSSGGAFSSLKGFTNNINDFLNNAFDLRPTPTPAPAPPAPRPAAAPPHHHQTRDCFNTSHAHRAPSPAAGARPERFTTTPGGERDIDVPVPPAAARSPSSDGARVETADCFEIEDLDDAGWEFVTRPAEPLPNDSDVLISAADALRRDSSHHDEPSSETRRAGDSRVTAESRHSAESGHSAESRHTAHSDFETVVETQLRNSRSTLSRDYFTPGPPGGAGGAGAALSASALELRGSRGADTDTVSLKDEPAERQTESGPGSPRAAPEPPASPPELGALTVKQLKELLARNRVEYRGCVERRELEERARRLWRARAAAAARGDDLPLEDSCKICMAAPLECVLLECGHIAACTACSKQLAECPICRQYVVRAVRFFRS